jgi:nitrogen regulatory protein PII-like uncharacterized protein
MGRRSIQNSSNLHQRGGGKVSNWSDKIVVIGVGISKEEADKIKEIIVEKVDNPSYDILVLFQG